MQIDAHGHNVDIDRYYTFFVVLVISIIHSAIQPEQDPNNYSKCLFELSPNVWLFVTNKKHLSVSFHIFPSIIVVGEGFSWRERVSLPRTGAFEGVGDGVEVCLLRCSSMFRYFTGKKVESLHSLMFHSELKMGLNPSLRLRISPHGPVATHTGHVTCVRHVVPGSTAVTMAT